MHKSIVRELVTEDIHIELMLPSLPVAKLQPDTRMRQPKDNNSRNRLLFCAVFSIETSHLLTYKKH